MKPLQALFLALPFAVIVGGAAYAQDDMLGDAEAGKELAEQWCTRCHDVNAGGAFKQHPPSFASIAVYRSADQIYGRITFPPLHGSMPRIASIMTPANLDHLVAYIVSLESSSETE
jgi:mono/diheme cytochrome c family protein